MAEVNARATTRMKQAYAPGSHRSYYNKYVMFLTFCLFYNIDVNNCINFIEFLAGSGITTATIVTYISAIKAKCLQVGLSSHCWSHHRGPHGQVLLPYGRSSSRGKTGSYSSEPYPAH